jgi:polyphenol oxidase
VTADGHIVVDLPGAQVLFTTRDGGVSPAPYNSLNLGFLTEDDATNVRQNRRVLADRHGIGLAYGLQVHRNRVRTVSEANTGPGLPPECDGVATSTPGVAPLVIAADCLPVAIAGGGAVAVVHAGWQGLANDVIAAGVAAVRALAQPGEQVAAAIGPGAGPCCYEVSDDLHRRFAARGQDFRRGQNLDLKAIAGAQLAAVGVARIEDVDLCTICGEQFFSHRREKGRTGRQGGLAWLS